MKQKFNMSYLARNMKRFIHAITNKLNIKHLGTQLNLTRKKIILIVEDDEPSYGFIQIVLGNSGFECNWVKNGDDAITVCKKNHDVQLVLMDINLPTISGYTATKEIKKLRPNLPVIAQTAYALAGDRKKALAAGCDDYISKPIQQKLLMDIIRKFLPEQ